MIRGERAPLWLGEKGLTFESSGCALPEKTLSLSRWGIVADARSSKGIMLGVTGTWLFTPMALSAAREPGLLANTLSLLMVASMSWRATFRRGATAAFLSARVGAREPSLAAARWGCAAEATAESIIVYAFGGFGRESPAAACEARRKWPPMAFAWALSRDFSLGPLAAPALSFCTGAD